MTTRGLACCAEGGILYNSSVTQMNARRERQISARENRQSRYMNREYVLTFLSIDVRATVVVLVFVKLAEYLIGLRTIGFAPLVGRQKGHPIRQKPAASVPGIFPV